MIFYLLLHILYKYVVKQDVSFTLHPALYNNETRLLYNYTQCNYGKKYDLRPIQNEEPSLEILIDSHKNKGI